MFIDSQFTWDYDSQMTEKYFAEYTRIEVRQFRDSLIQHMESVKKSIDEKRQYDRRVNKRLMQMQESKVVSSKELDASLVVTECSGTKSDEHITSSSSGTYITHVVDADIRPVNDQVSSAEVHLTTQHNILANEQQHTDQSKPSFDTYLLEKVDSNTTPNSTNMSHRGGEIDQDAEQDQVKIPLLKDEFLKTNDMVEKEVYNELSNRFLQLEKHCISLEISMQQKEESFQSNKPCKNQESPEFREFFEINDLKAQLQAKTTLICNLKNQIKSVKEASNEAKLKKEINVLETINIELESSVAKLLAENEKLNKENEHLKQTYKELYDSIKKTRIQMKDHNDSLIAQVNSKTVENADLKAQIQEKVFANAALKNELRKLNGTINVINVLSKPITPYYLPKVQEYVLSKPHHVIAPGSSRNSQEEYYGSNDMAHNHYLEEARKNTQERNRNLKPSVIPSVRLQNTANGSTPNPKRPNQTSRSLPTSKSSCITITAVPKADHSKNSSSFSDSKHFFCSTCHKCVFNANHDACITKLLNEVNSRKVKPHKTKNSNNPVEQKSHTQKPGRQISSGHRFSPKKTSVVYEKTSPRSCLRWIPTGRIFKLAGLRWIPTGKMFIDSTTKASLFNDKWRLLTTLQAPVLKEKKGVRFSALYLRKKRNLLVFDHSYQHDSCFFHARSVINSGPGPQLMTPRYISSGLVQNPVSSTPYVPPSKKDYTILFQPLFDEYFNPPSCAVSLDLVAVVAQELLIQPIHLHQLPLIKMYHLLLLHQQIKKFNLKSLIKVLKN
ncbi:hypothetical protein Tco_0690992 [Tanacetum coccineum]